MLKRNSLTNVDLILLLIVAFPWYFTAIGGYFIDDIDNIIPFITFFFSALVVALASYSYKNKELYILRRVFLLGAAGVLGLFSINEIATEDGNISENIKEYINYLNIVGPTLFILWIFRTYDVQKQQENSNLFQCVRLLTDEKSTSQRIALEQLAYMKKETSFDEERIDMLTRRLVLKNKNFISAQLNSIDLSFAVLEDTILKSTNLNGADLRKANLVGANLVRANLGEANLKNTNLKDAKYNQDTKFPDGFDPDKAGMTLVEY